MITDFDLTKLSIDDKIFLDTPHQRMINKFFRIGKSLGYYPLIEFSTWNINQSRKQNRTDVVWIKDKRIEYAFEIETNKRSNSFHKFEAYPDSVKKYLLSYYNLERLIILKSNDTMIKSFVKLLLDRNFFLDIIPKKRIFWEDKEYVSEKMDKDIRKRVLLNKLRLMRNEN